MVGFAFWDDQTSVHHRLQISLQRPAVHLGTKPLEILDGQAAVRQDVGEDFGLTT